MHLAINVVKIKGGYKRQPTNEDNSSRQGNARVSKSSPPGSGGAAASAWGWFQERGREWWLQERGQGVVYAAASAVSKWHSRAGSRRVSGCQESAERVCPRLAIDCYQVAEHLQVSTASLPRGWRRLPLFGVCVSAGTFSPQILQEYTPPRACLPPSVSSHA
jgi:hypothetical protein